MKRMITLTVIGVTFMLVFLQSNGGLKVERVSEFSYNGHVYFNGRDQNIPALFSKSSSSIDVELPLVCTLSQLGVRVEWEDSGNAILEYAGQAYLLDINTKTFVPKKKKDVNLLLLPPGSTKGLTVLNKEVLVSYGLFMYVTQQMNIDIKSVDLNTEKNYIDLSIME